MFHSWTQSNRINNIHKRALRVVFIDCESNLKQVLKQNGFVSIHQRNLQILATEIFKTKNGLNPVIMEEVFKSNNFIYNFLKCENSQQNVDSVKYGSKTITSLGARIWKILPSYYKELTSLSMFKSKIKNWETDEYLCRLCKMYIQRVGFI